MNKRKIKITFTDTEKRIDMERIAAAVAKTLKKGGIKDVERKKVL